MNVLKILIPLTLLVGCKQDTELRAITPVVTVAPAVLDFGEQAVPVAVTQDMYISGGSAATLRVTDMVIEGEGAGAFSVAETSNLEISQDLPWLVPVQFLPDSFLDYDATLTIFTNDPSKEELVVPLSGVGVNKPLPDILVTPQTIDFGTVASGGDAFEQLIIQNIGQADLDLGALEQSGSGAFKIGEPTDPSYYTLAANSPPHSVLVVYEPQNDNGDNGTITIVSNDPDEEEVEVILLGNGGGSFEYPEALINCPATASPPEWISLDGSASNDPAGNEPLDYLWSLTTPTGSEAVLSNFATVTTDFFADVAGDYEVQLQVINTLGVVSAPARCQIEAIPADKVHIELTWDTQQADMDLHVLEDGAIMFEKPGDCNWCNRNPKWGSAGSDNDPRLDIDDKAGRGPENINILDPDNGRYYVKVHYFEDHGDTAVTAIVKVYLNGSKSWEGSKVMQRNDVWDVGIINWPTNNFGVQSTSLYSQGTQRQCF